MNRKFPTPPPRFVSFRGFSLIFDPPADCLRNDKNIQYLDCHVEHNTSLRIYKELFDFISNDKTILRLTENSFFFPLPPSSYHVTLWSGINKDNLIDVFEAKRSSLHDCLVSLPDSIAFSNEAFEIISASPLARRDDLNVQFKFLELTYTKNALVARLNPSERATSVFRMIENERRSLSSKFRESFGVSPKETYDPHITLGYFTNPIRPNVQKYLPKILNQSIDLKRKLDREYILFNSASVYGFTDIRTFFKRNAF